jgi:dihydroorotase
VLELLPLSMFEQCLSTSKLLHLALRLTDVVRGVTTTPAACIGRVDELDTLAPGAAADVSVFRLAEGEWTFRDSSLEEETGAARLEPVAVIRAGHVFGCTPAAY